MGNFGPGFSREVRLMRRCCGLGSFPKTCVVYWWKIQSLQLLSFMPQRAWITEMQQLLKCVSHLVERNQS